MALSVSSNIYIYIYIQGGIIGNQMLGSGRYKENINGM